MFTPFLKDAMILNPSGPTSCISKGKSEWNLTPLPRQTFVPGIGEGVARCPYDPNDNSTAVWVEHGNPDNLPGLYSGTTAEFTKADTVIFRTDLYNVTSHEKRHNFKRTLKYDSIWLDKPNFVGSFDIGDYVYFFFREPAVEYMNCGKNIFSRVARVCKTDRGGKNILVNNWVTYLKARLNCSLPGDYPFYFNEIQSVYKVPGDDSRIYAVFTTVGSGFRGSAVCAFSLSSIESVFRGKFKEQATSSSSWLPVLKSKVPQPRPGECVNDTQALPDNVVNFIRSHPIMDEAVPQEHGKPLFFMQDLTFTKVVVEEISISNPRNPGQSRTYTVLFVASNEGKIYKIVQWKNEDGRMRSELVDVLEGTYPEPIRTMEISVEFSSLYVGSDYRVRQIPTDSCGARYDNCVRCVRDPYCGWDTENGLCKPYTAGLLQSVGGNDTICNCRRCSPTKLIQATWGQSLYLQCAVNVPGHVSANSIASQPYVWYHFPTSSQGDNGEPRAIKFSSEKYVLAADRGIVILSTTETDAGRWQLRYEDGDVSLQLCSYNVTINIQKCSAPTEAPEFQKVYAEWCHEFQKYKKAMQLWQQKQEQCGSKKKGITSDSNDYNTNDIYPSNIPYG
ncbi:Semaphorin-2A [Orchesella cincta]|uniref:Semaphorin-2A n=1 Tax=Orchesella cincta TaxID=48709 RepID=A0A1D2N0F1_ORCCI|nr:Semaphorin-2A [Orchesella cincta]